MAIINTRIGISENLPTGAKYELLLIDYPDGYPEGKLEFQFNNTPRKITGIQKVAQTFLKILFTTKGSDVINPGLGTNFSDYTVNANRAKDDPELMAAITAEVSDAETQCKAILNDLTSDDASQLADITILALDTSSESITMYLRLLTLAGEGAQVAVPFPQLDMKLSPGN